MANVSREVAADDTARATSSHRTAVAADSSPPSVQGGIRCVKVAAYLTQNLRFTNVSRLAGGVVAYDRTLREAAPADEEPMFKGVNYVFDDRMGRRITEDQLGTCETCGRKTHLVSNCKNSNCHKR